MILILMATTLFDPQHKSIQDSDAVTMSHFRYKQLLSCYLHAKYPQIAKAEYVHEALMVRYETMT